MKRLILVLLLMTASAGCSSRASQPSDLNSLVDALRTEGLDVGEVRTGQFFGPLLGPPNSDDSMSSFVVEVGVYEIQVIEFDEPADARSSGISVGSVNVDLPRPHMWRSGRMIIIFEDGTGPFADTLSEILGKPTVAPVWSPAIDDD